MVMDSNSDDSDHEAGNLQQKLLNQLEQYGDSMLGPREFESKTKKSKKFKKKRPAEQLQTHTVNKISKCRSKTPSLKHKPVDKVNGKERAKPQGYVCDSSSGSEDRVNSERDADCEPGSKHKHLRDIKASLGLANFVKEQKTLKIRRAVEAEIAAREKQAALEKQRKRPAPEVIVFDDPARRKKKSPSLAPSLPATRGTGPSPSVVEFDLKQARYDVQKFGIKGMDKSRKEDAQVALAVKLGAKPPKNKCVNYKEFQEIRKKEQADQVKQREMDRCLGYKVSSANGRTKKKVRDKNDIGIVDGQIGRYKNGVQVLRKEDITSVTRQKKHI